ncbi:MAG TPA: sugar nucleotide-binding protein [Micromonosporaceae bacterium]
MTLLVTGASGYTGSRLARLALAAGWQVVGTYHRAPGEVSGVDWRQLDVRDRQAVRALLRTVRPRAVVHAAYARPDWAVNADGTAYVALASVEVGARLVHVSSDAVFAGRAQPYTEADPPEPVYAYGAAKAAAETAVRAIAPDAVLARTSLIVGDRDSAQHRLVLDLVAGRRGGTLFTDEIRCPIAVDDLAAALLELVDSDRGGVLHVAGAAPVSRYELGRLIAAYHGLDPDRVPAGTIAGSGLPRPARVELDCTRAATLLRTRLRGAPEVLPAGGDPVDQGKV